MQQDACNHKDYYFPQSMTRTHQETRQQTWTFLQQHRTCRGQRLCPL